MGIHRAGRSPSRRFWGLALAGLLVALIVPFANAWGTPGVPATVTVAVSPSCIKADHLSTSTATATVKDSNGLPVPGQTVAFATNGDVTFGPVTDHADGTYTSTITSSATADVETISANAGGKTGTAQLTESSITAASVALTVSPGSVRAGGTTTATATATVKDAANRCVGGDTVTFAASPAGPVFSSTTDHGDGTYTATILPSSTPGTETITAHDGALTSNSQSLIQFGPTNSIALTLTPSTITANGTDTSTATATLTDAGGRLVNDATVVFSTDGDSNVGSTTNNHDGTYTAPIKASTTADKETITALAEGKSHTAQLTETPGAAASVTVKLNPTSIPADGLSHSTATATVKDANNNPVTTENVSFKTSGDVTLGAVKNVGDGTYTSQITASTTADTETITATTSNNKSGSAPLTETAGAANALTLTLNPTSIAADGTSTSTATAVVKDANGNGAPGVNVGFGTSGDVTFSPNNATTDSTGTAKSTIKASSTADKETITANGGGKTDSQTLTEYGPAKTVAVNLSNPAIVANGSDHSTATATVTDVNGNPVLNETVAFTTNGDVTFGAVTNHGDGTYTSQITASKTADSETITATATKAGKSGVATLTENADTPIVTVTLNPSTIVADGASHSTATAAVKDANGNPYPNETVAFTTTGDVTFGNVTKNGDGTYTSQITASKTADPETITATDAAKNKSGTAMLTETNGPATSVVFGLNPSSLTADGTSTSTATATLKDANNNAVTNETVTMTTSGDAKVGAVTNNSDGTYTATITASKTADTETITATATKAGKSGTATLTENAGPPVLGLTLAPSSIPADNVSTSKATASVKDVNGNPYKTETVTIATDGDTKVSAVTNNNDGTYTATITASKTADQETITANDAAKSLTKTATLTETASGTGFHPLPPTRILDTRAQNGGGPLQPNSQRKVQITGAGGVPASHVSGVVLNLTATQASTQTYLTVFPSGSPPNSSNLNIGAGRDAANLVTAQVAGDGSVQLYNAQGTVHAIFDIVGYYDDGSVATPRHYAALNPARILDTRSGSPLGPNSTRTVPITGHGGVPTTHVTAVVLNLTGTEESTGTYLTVFPSGTPPTASNINLQPGENRANLVMVPVAADGTVQLYNAQGTAHAIFDVTGYFDDGTVSAAKGFTALAPSRILDTRNGFPVGQGESRTVTVAGHGGVPAAGATAVVINITATRASDGTFVTVFPQSPRPTVSNVNVPPGTDIPNLAVATLAPDGTVQLYNDRGSVDVIFDVVGWFGS